MEEIKLVKEKTPINQIKPDEIDLERHLVVKFGLTTIYVLTKETDGTYSFVNTIKN